MYIELPLKSPDNIHNREQNILVNKNFIFIFSILYYYKSYKCVCV